MLGEQRKDILLGVLVLAALSSLVFLPPKLSSSHIPFEASRYTMILPPSAPMALGLKVDVRKCSGNDDDDLVESVINSGGDFQALLNHFTIYSMFPQIGLTAPPLLQHPLGVLVDFAGSGMCGLQRGITIDNEGQVAVENGSFLGSPDITMFTVVSPLQLGEK